MPANQPPELETRYRTGSATFAIIVLPGFDGTGFMLERFIGLLDDIGPTTLMAYPDKAELDYAALLHLVLEQLPPGKIVVVAESFSGPLALRLAHKMPDRVAAIVLGASFARLDLPFAGLLRQVVPVAPVHSTPRALLNALLMGGRGSRLQLLRLRAAINGIPANVLRTRAKAALTVDLPAEQLAVDQPLLYLRARRDRLMPASAEQTVRAVAKHSQAIAIDGPHFLFEFEPDACAREIAGFLARVGLR